MKSGAPLKCTGSLASKATLAVRKPLKATKRKITGRSQRAIDFEAEYQAVRPSIIERAQGKCEIGIQCNHEGPVEHVHHAVVGRSHGGSNLPHLLWACCEADHTWLHGHVNTPGWKDIIKERRWITSLTREERYGNVDA